MRYLREIKVAVLAIVSLTLLYFGFNYLKGINVFKPVHNYHGLYANVNGLTVQAPVFVKGYKVGQVDQITYDFTRDTSFLVDISINKDIRLPHGTKMALFANGLLGGTAVELEIPVVPDSVATYAAGSYLPTLVIPGLMDNLETGLMVRISNAVANIDLLVQNINGQLTDDHLKHILRSVDSITVELTTVSHDMKGLMHNKVPGIVDNVDKVVADLTVFSGELKKVDINGTVGRVDSVLNNVNAVVADVRSDNGTLGLLLRDKRLYEHIDATVLSADSLVKDIKERPRHYLYPLGAKEKKTKK